MIDFLKWLMFGLLLGWISLPLTWRLFVKLPSRGYYLAKAVGLLAWGFLFWISVSLGLLSNNLSSQLTVLFVLVIVNGFILYRVGWHTFWNWIKDNRKAILVSEIVFLVFFGIWTIVRAANPDIIHTEKFMEMAFINGILRSDSFPPMDPWLSGYGISYYYFAYVLSAMLIRITSVVSSVGYNLVSAFWFGLTAMGAYGILSDLLIFSKTSKSNGDEIVTTRKKVQWLALLAPVMLLIVSNWFGAMDVASSRGIGLQMADQDQIQSSFWQDFNIPELQNPPREASWRPDRGGWSWWQASRVLRDRTLSGNTVEVIDEFPQFTFLLSDIHPHMLGMPFVLLAIAQALNAIKGGWEGKVTFVNKKFGFDILVLFFVALSLGGIAFLNTWDFPFYLALIVACAVYRHYVKDGWKMQRIFEFFALAIVVGLLSILLYLPFYLSFASQAGGILPSLAFFTPGKNFWVMFGPFLVAILIYLLYFVVTSKSYKCLLRAAAWILVMFVLLFVLSWGIGWLGIRHEMTRGHLLGLQGAVDGNGLLINSILARLKAPGTAITLFVILTLSMALVLDDKKKFDTNRQESTEDNATVKANVIQKKPAHVSFILFLIILGALLTLAPEFIYLRDNFGWRMNTIFKFYFQAWIVWSIAASYAIVVLFKRFKNKGVPNAIFATLIGLLGLVAFALSLKEKAPLPAGFGALHVDWLVLAIVVLFVAWIIWHLIKKQFTATLAVISLIAVCGGLVYPVLEIWNKTEGFQPHLGYSLDGKRIFRQSDADAMLAAEWLETAPIGVMAEAVADQGGSYTTYNMISTFSGMPSVLGWVGHEHQWRGGGAEIGSRQQDLRDLYSTKNLERFNEIINQYNIRYIVFGNYERDTYRMSDLRFAQSLEPAFRTESVIIYEVRQ